MTQIVLDCVGCGKTETVSDKPDLVRHRIAMNVDNLWS